MKVCFLIYAKDVSSEHEEEAQTLAERKLPVGIVSRQDMFPLQQHDVLPGWGKACEMVNESSDVLLCGKVVVSHGESR